MKPTASFYGATKSIAIREHAVSAQFGFSTALMVLIAVARG